MSKHYFVRAKNSWGASKNLTTAMEYADVRFSDVFGSGIRAIRYATADSLKEELLEIKKYPEDCMDEGIEKFQVVIVDSDDWEFNEANEYDGTPNYNWKGKGEMPDKVPTLCFNLTLDLATGLILQA